MSYAEPLVDGHRHGWARQFDPRGRLILESPFRQGTGIDFWCDYDGRLAEEHPCVNGAISGCDRWWDDDQKHIYEETHFLNGERHGIKRAWRGKSLKPGFPEFYVHDKRLSKRDYLAAAARDSTLAPYRKEDDDPARTLPERFVQLRQRVLRRS